MTEIIALKHIECTTSTQRRKTKVPLRVGDVWVYLGPATEVRIIALSPRPTNQKPDAQQVETSDGRVLAEATFRGAFKYKKEYQEEWPALAAKWDAAVREFYDERASVIPFRRKD